MKLLLVFAVALVCATAALGYNRNVILEATYQYDQDSCAYPYASQTLDNIVWNEYPGRAIAIVWHISGGDYLYSTDGNNKMEQYPPPYEDGYFAPWLWVDGVSTTSTFLFWENYVDDEINLTTPVGITLEGNYDNPSRTGTVAAEFLNTSGSDITANAYFVVTEDSVVSDQPNGDTLNNHVCREYIPDANGTSVTVPAGSTDSLGEDFTLDPSWNSGRCNMICYLQVPPPPVESSLPVYQGVLVPLRSWGAGIAESRVTPLPREMTVGPNPSRGLVSLTLSGHASPQEVRVADISGRLVESVSIPASSSRTMHQIDLRSLADGVYFVSLASSPATTKKIVVQR
jgi:hypothetical protein